MSRARGWADRLVISGPGVLLLFLFVIGPLVATLPYALYSMSGLGRPAELAGFAQLWAVASDPRFWWTAARTLAFAAATTLVLVPIALGLALWSVFGGAATAPARILQVALLAPLSLSGVAGAIVAQVLLASGWRGFGWELAGIVADPLASPPVALALAVILDAWQSIGVPFLLFSAALRSLPERYFELGAIVGLRGFRLHRVVTLPLVGPVLLVASVLELLHRVAAFDAIYVLTGGGPFFSTEVMAVHVYRRALGGRTEGAVDLGQAAAAAFLFTVLVLLVVAASWPVIRRWEVLRR